MENISIPPNNSDSHPVQNYYDYFVATNSSNCKLCKRTFKGKHSSNLLQNRHKRVYSDILPEVVKYHQNKRKGSNKRVTVTYNLEELTKSFVSMVTIDGRPFSIMDDVGMKGILNPIFEACDKSKIDYRINRRNISDYTAKYEQCVESKIIEETKDKIVSCQMDIASVHERYFKFHLNHIFYRLYNCFSFDNRSILGILMHYEFAGRSVTRLIGIKRLLASHTGVFIAKNLKDALDRFKVPVDNVYAVSTDNGKNMVRSVEVFKLFQSHLVDDFLLNDSPFHEREQAYNLFIDRELKRHERNLEIEPNNYAVSVHCAAHTLELSIKDAMKFSVEENEIIEKVRS